MVEFTFMTYDDDDGMKLGTVKWPVLPRKGETVVLDGLVARKDADKQEKPIEEVVFVVDDIVYRDDVLDGDRDFPPDIEVWLALPPNERVWKGTDRASESDDEPSES